MDNKEYTLQYICDFLNAELIGDPVKIINSIGSIDIAEKNQITFVHNPKYTKFLNTTKAGAILINKKHVNELKNNYIIVEDAYLAYAKLTKLFSKVKLENKNTNNVNFGENCSISNENVFISPNVVIGKNVTIESNVVIRPFVNLGDNVTIKEGTFINSNVSIYDNVKIGKHCIIHSGTVLGADGFGFAKDINGSWCKIHQLGKVLIGNNVEIGANTTIDCGALVDTIIHDGVKLDNQIQIGHNVEIGKNTIMAGCSAVAGSTKIGANCAIGGFSVIAGHLSICDNVMITGGSGVTGSIKEPGVYSSGASGVISTNVWRKNVVRYKNLDQMFKRLKKIESQVEILTLNNSEELENA